jgi:hypothetical protein
MEIIGRVASASALALITQLEQSQHRYNCSLHALLFSKYYIQHGRQFTISFLQTQRNKRAAIL